MAGQRLTDKSSLTTTPGTGDLLMIVDVNDTTGSADGTSKKIDNKFFLQTDKITISNAEFLDLHTDGRILVSSPGAGFAIIPISVYCKQTVGASGNNTTMGITIGHKNKETDYYWSSTRFWPKTSTYDGISFIFAGQEGSAKGAYGSEGIDDQGLYMWAKTASPTGGSTNTMEVWVTYRIIDIS